mgnify:FL=1
MATTIKARPLNLTPTYNETIVVLEDQNVNLDNFKWLVHIYKGISTDSDYQLLSTIVILPNPEGYGVIDFHRHIENYISTTFFPEYLTRISQKVTNEGLKWSFEVTTQYINTETVQTFPSGSNVIYSFNGALSFQDFRNWNSDDYEMSSTSLPTIKFLLDGDSTIDASLSDRVWINSFMSTSLAPFDLVKIETDNGVYTVPQTFTPTGQHFINQNKIGPKDILETSDTFTVVSGALPVVDSSTTFIKVTPLNGSSIAIGETVTLNIKDYCSKYEHIKFFYMDKLGSYLPVTFNKVSKNNITNTRSNYKQNYGSYNNISNTYGYTSHDRGTTNYDLTSTEVITCTSDWMSEESSRMVVSMLNSPSVYIQDSTGEYIAINITTNSYEQKKTVNDKLINYTISFEYSNTNTNQRG